MNELQKSRSMREWVHARAGEWTRGVTGAPHIPPDTVRKVVGGGFDGRLTGLHVRSLFARYSYSHTQIVHVRTGMCTLTSPSLPYGLYRNPFVVVRPCRCMHVRPSADASSAPPRHLQNPPTRQWWPRPVNENIELKKQKKKEIPERVLIIYYVIE